MINPIQLIIGIILALFLPGYLIVKLFFTEFKKLEQFVFSVAFSIMVSIAIAIFFGYDEAQALRTGGLTFQNILIAELIICTVLGLLLWYRNRPKHKYHDLRYKEKRVESLLPKKKFILIKGNPGLSQFIIRTIIFFTILFAVYFFIFLYFRHTLFFRSYLALGGEFYFDFLSGLRKRDFINAALFSSVIFFVWNRNTLLKFKEYSQNKSQTILFFILALLTQVGHYLFKYWINLNLEFASSHALFMTLTKYSFNLAFILFLALAVYNITFFKTQFHKFKRQILPFGGLLALYFFVIQVFQMFWRVFGNFVAGSLHFLLGLSFDNVSLVIEAGRNPMLGVGGFVVGISEECSGIDSMLLFLSLFAVLLILDWDTMNRKRMFMLLIPGILGTIGYNILRIYLLMLVGVFISRDFAVDMFHTNIGWILFLLFFMLFWHFGSKWVYVKKKG